MSALNRDCLRHDTSLSRQQVKVSKSDRDRHRERESTTTIVLSPLFPHGSPMQSNRDMIFAPYTSLTRTLFFVFFLFFLLFLFRLPLPLSLFSSISHDPFPLLTFSHPPSLLPAPLFITSLSTFPTPSTFTTHSSCVPQQPFLPPSSSPSPPSRLRMLPPSPRPPSLATSRPALP